MKRLILILLLPALLYPQTAEEIAKKAEAKLRSYRSFQADFKQFYYSATISTPLEEKGKLYLMKPGWMKWEYKDPEKKIFLLKDGLYQQYLVEEKQLLESDLSTEESEFNVFTLLSGSTGILENYTVELSPFPTDNTRAHQLKLTPREEDPDTFILLEINEKTWNIDKAVFFDWSGNKQEFHFSRIKTNVEFPKNTFELKLPPDVEIIK